VVPNPGSAAHAPCSAAPIEPSGQPIELFSPSAFAKVFGHACAANGASDVGVTPTTITLGVINFMSATRSLGPLIAGATQRLIAAELQWMNDHGGVAGRTLKLLTCDDGGDVTRARACFEKLRHQVFAFLPSETFLTDTIHDLLDQTRIPWLTWGWFTSEWNDPYMFPCHGNGLRETANMANWMAGNIHNLHTVGILYLNDAEDIAGRDVAVRIFQQRGIKVVAQIAQEWDSPDEQQHVLAMRVANPDAVLSPTWPTSLAKFFHDAEQQHWAPPLGIYAKHLIADAGYGGIFGDYAKNRFYSINSWVIPGGIGNTSGEDVLPGNEFIKMLSAKYTGYENSGFKTKYTIAHHISQSAVACTMAFAYAASQLGPDLTRTALINRLETERFDSGMGQTLRWPHGDHSSEPYAFHNEYLYEWTDGDADGGFGVKRIRPDPVTPAIPS
jgi:ABC-type branched-subunit amino acid transport system substrate-binding protein